MARKELLVLLLECVGTVFPAPLQTRRARDQGKGCSGFSLTIITSLASSNSESWRERNTVQQTGSGAHAASSLSSLMSLV